MDERELLQRLVDIEDIKRLKARYFRSLDTKDWDEFAQVFAQDAHLEVPERDVSEDGRQAVVRSVSTVLEGVTTVHHGHTPEIEITGDDTARGTWAMFDYIEFPAAEGGERFGLKGYGHYTEDYVREDGEWRIKRLELSRLRIDPLGEKPAGALGWRPALTSADGRPTPQGPTRRVAGLAGRRARYRRASLAANVVAADPTLVDPEVVRRVIAGWSPVALAISGELALSLRSPHRGAAR